MWAAYYGQISYVDHLMGIILEALIATEQLDDTLIVFTSDHGDMLGSHGLLYKGEVLYEELVNIPLLIAPPGGLSHPHQTRRLVSHVDVLPTVLRWCGAPVPDYLQGQDVRLLVEGDDAPINDGVAFEYHSTDWGERPVPLRGWRTERWKYVETVGGQDELYDLASDPAELHNVVDDPAYAGARAAQRAQLHQWLRRTGDTWPSVALPSRYLSPSDTRWPDYVFAGGGGAGTTPAGGRQ